MLSRVQALASALRVQAVRSGGASSSADALAAHTDIARSLRDVCVDDPQRLAVCAPHVPDMCALVHAQLRADDEDHSDAAEDLRVALAALLRDLSYASECRDQLGTQLGIDTLVALARGSQREAVYQWITRAILRLTATHARARALLRCESVRDVLVWMGVRALDDATMTWIAAAMSDLMGQRSLPSSSAPASTGARDARLSARLAAPVPAHLRLFLVPSVHRVLLSMMARCTTDHSRAALCVTLARMVATSEGARLCADAITWDAIVAMGIRSGSNEVRGAAYDMLCTLAMLLAADDAGAGAGVGTRATTTIDATVMHTLLPSTSADAVVAVANPEDARRSHAEAPSLAVTTLVGARSFLARFITTAAPDNSGKHVVGRWPGLPSSMQPQQRVLAPARVVASVLAHITPHASRNLNALLCDAVRQLFEHPPPGALRDVCRAARVLVAQALDVGCAAREAAGVRIDDASDAADRLRSVRALVDLLREERFEIGDEASGSAGGLSAAAAGAAGASVLLLSADGDELHVSRRAAVLVSGTLRNMLHGIDGGDGAAGDSGDDECIPVAAVRTRELRVFADFCEVRARGDAWQAHRDAVAALPLVEHGELVNAAGFLDAWPLVTFERDDLSRRLCLLGFDGIARALLE